MNASSMSFLATRNELPLPGCSLAGKSKISQLLKFIILSWVNSSDWERRSPAEASQWNDNFCVKPLDASAEHHHLNASSRYYWLRKGKALKFLENSRDACRSAPCSLVWSALFSGDLSKGRKQNLPLALQRDNSGRELSSGTWGELRHVNADPLLSIRTWSI